MSIVACEDILEVLQTLNVNGTDTSTNSTTGALVVTSGGAGIGENVNIGGDLNTEGESNLQNTLTLGTGTSSYSFPDTSSGSHGDLLQYSTTGALIFTNPETATSVILNSLPGVCNLLKTLGTGTEVEATNIVVSSDDDLTGVNSINVDDNSTFGSDLAINGTSSSTNNTSGALVIGGGVGITENLNVGGDVCFDGDVKIAGEMTLGSGTASYSFPTTQGSDGEILVLGTSGTFIYQLPSIDFNDDVLAPTVFGTDNRLIRTLGTTGRDVEVTGVSISDNNDISGINTVDIASDSTIGGVLTLSSTASSTGTNTGALVVAGGVGIAENLNIGGDTNIEGTASINNTTESNDTTSGALVVEGGVGVGGNVNVGGEVNAGAYDLTDTDIILSSTQASNDTTSGALVVSGGVGIGDDVNIGGNTNIDGELTTDGPFIITDTTSSVNNTTGALIIAGGLGLSENLNMGGVLNVNNTTGSTSTDTGALVSDGGVGIAENLNVGGDINSGGDFTINSTTNSTGTGTGALVVDGGASVSEDLYVGGNLYVDDPVIASSKFFNALHTATVSASSTTYVAVPWNTEIRKDTALYTHGAGSADVDVTESGWYEITAEIATQIEAGDGTIRTIGKVRITVNGSPVTETDSYLYNRTSQRGHYTTNITIIQNLSASDTINIEFNRELGTSTITSIANGCRLFVARI